MAKAVVEGASCQVNQTNLDAGPESFNLSVASSGNVKSETKKVALKTDTDSQSPITADYSTPTYSVPGSMKWDGKMTGVFESAKLTKDGNGVVTNATPSGTAKWDVTTPAQMPPPASTPDLTPSYIGDWTILDPGQTKLSAIG